MSFKLNFEISLSTGCCDQLQLCDTTGDYNPNKETSDCGGYNIIDDGIRTLDVFRSDVFSTCFNWVMPDGTTFTSKDLLFVPAKYASVEFTLGAGVAGDWVIAIIEDVSLGSAIFVTDISQLTYDLVHNINLNSAVTGWYAYYVGATITIYRLDSGTEFNGNTLEIILNAGTSITTVIPTDQTSGGNDSDDCTTLRITDLYGRFNCPQGLSCWPDGVYTITYIIKDVAGVELARKQKKFLLDCNVAKCIYNQIKALSADSCNCSDDAWQKVLRLKMDLEAVHDEFCEQNYTCANEKITDLMDNCKNLCLDC